MSILLVAIIWGSSYVVMQTVAEKVPTAAFLALRFITALPAVLILAGPSLRRLNRIEILAGLMFGAFLYGILMLETIGVQHTSAANAGFLITVSVIVVPLLERLISKRSQSPVVYLSIVAALFGCALLLLHDGIQPRSGDLIILAAAMIRATQITLFGRHVSGQSIQNLTVVEFVFVVVLASATSAVWGDPVWEVAGQVDTRSWLLIAYLGVLGTSFAFFAQLRSARLSSSTRVGLILCTEPLFATMFAVGVAGETLSFGQAVGGFVMVASALVGRAAEASGRAGDYRPLHLRVQPSVFDRVRRRVLYAVARDQREYRRPGHRHGRRGRQADPRPPGGPRDVGLRVGPAGWREQGDTVQTGVGAGQSHY